MYIYIGTRVTLYTQTNWARIVSTSARLRPFSGIYTWRRSIAKDWRVHEPIPIFPYGYRRTLLLFPRIYTGIARTFGVKTYNFLTITQFKFTSLLVDIYMKNNAPLPQNKINIKTPFGLSCSTQSVCVRALITRKPRTAFTSDTLPTKPSTTRCQTMYTRGRRVKKKKKIEISFHVGQ